MQGSFQRLQKYSTAGIVLLIEMKAAVVLSILGLCSISFGVWRLYRAPSQPPSPEVVVCSDAETPQVVVAISGGVHSPGVYAVAEGSRVADVIAAAAGFSGDSDTGYIQQSVNLAQKVSDGEKLHIPLQGELELCRQLTTGHEQESLQNSISSYKVSLNTATAAELEELPGIGEKRAKDIIASRPYTSINELLERDVLTESQLGEIQDKLQL